MTDWQRVVAYLQAHPGSSRGELQQALGWAVNVTARISDARANHVEIVKERDGKGVWRYSVKSRPAVLQGEQVSAW